MDNVEATPSSLSTTFGYDAAGNTTNLVFNSGSNFDLEWDERYRLTNVDGASASITYGYDVLDRKVSRAEDSITEQHIFNGNHIVADVDNNGDLLRTYAWGPGCNEY